MGLCWDRADNDGMNNVEANPAVRRKRSILSVRWVQLGIVPNALLIISWWSGVTLRGIAADWIVVSLSLILCAVSGAYAIWNWHHLRFSWLLPILQFPSSLILVMILVCIAIPVLLLPLGFFVAEQGGTRDIYSEASSDGSYTLTVRYTGVGAYTGGMGRFGIVKSSSATPFFEQEIYFQSSTDLRESDTAFFIWGDHAQILIPETGVVVRVD